MRAGDGGQNWNREMNLGLLCLLSFQGTWNSASRALHKGIQDQLGRMEQVFYGHLSEDFVLAPITEIPYH